MTFEELLKVQWSEYAERHRDRVNLLIHIVAVPLFWIGSINALGALLFSGLFAALGGLLLMALSLFAQGIGHDREALQPQAFAGAWDFVRRIVAEQFITFPRFVLSGGWLRNLEAGSR
ncbi:terminase [Fontimonas sp. SYSU GA230001]|uniref:terminase n=1 Tax=Fontimonas sp. SYSU GA230001 TaxID=3142450 RepID=UPI0032B4D7F8